MLLDAVRSLFAGGPAPAEPEAGAASGLDQRAAMPGPDGVGRPAPAASNGSAAPPEDGPENWPAERVAMAEYLWGEGFVGPTGTDEVQRLVKPLGLTAAASLMLVGAALGGPVRAVVTGLGVWVTGYESDPELAAIAMGRSTRTGLGRRAAVEVWYPGRPDFPRRAYHHALLLEPLRGAPAIPVLTACAGALRAGGQIAMTELVADAPLDFGEPGVRAWCALEGRALSLPTEQEITRALGRLGFDVRVAEDISARHIHLALLAWRVALREVARARPPRREAFWLLREAEQWLRRLRLMQAGRVRLVRWHAIAGAGAPG